MSKITVIIPSYNHEKFISDAINSVLRQTFQNFEILIIDDGSCDNSVEIIQKFNDPRIKFSVNDRNCGAVYTTNKMIELASGEYIALLNSDDVWEPTKLEKQVQFLEDNKNYGAVFTQANIIKEDGDLLEDKSHNYGSIFEQPNRTRFEWLNYFFNVGNALCHPSILVRREVYQAVGLYNPLMASLPDFDMWVRVCLKYEIYVLPEKLVKFRILDNNRNASSATPENIIACQFEYKQILNSFLSLSVHEYEEIFNEPVVNDVAFSLALKAISRPDRFKQAWGLDTLYVTLKKLPEYMVPKEFIKLTREHDVFHVR
jgi:glycosyltransferase involved in cell wall biosynthesis